MKKIPHPSDRTPIGSIREREIREERRAIFADRQARSDHEAERRAKEDAIDLELRRELGELDHDLFDGHGPSPRQLHYRDLAEARASQVVLCFDDRLLHGAVHINDRHIVPTGPAAAAGPLDRLRIAGRGSEVVVVVSFECRTFGIAELPSGWRLELCVGAGGATPTLFVMRSDGAPLAVYAERHGSTPELVAVIDRSCPFVPPPPDADERTP